MKKSDDYSVGQKRLIKHENIFFLAISVRTLPGAAAILMFGMWGGGVVLVNHKVMYIKS